METSLEDRALAAIWENGGRLGIARKNLGDEMPVFLYRVFQYHIRDQLTKRYGKKEADAVVRDAGYAAGIEFAGGILERSLTPDEFLEILHERFIENKLGVLRVEHFDLEQGRAVLTIGEDLDCSGLPPLGEPVCVYDEGFLAGLFHAYTRREVSATEVDCWATGSLLCRFEVTIA